MNPLTEKILASGYANRVIDESQLARMLSGSRASRYGLVNRALKFGELHRVRRGIYVLDDRWRRNPVHPYALAQALLPGSYVSFETALAWHSWIPEAVMTIVSVTPGRKSKDYQHTRFGRFTFQPIAVYPSGFLELVERQQVEQQSFLIASPFRALMDLVCFRKQRWTGMGWITDGLRIDAEFLSTLAKEDFTVLMKVYKHSRVLEFLAAFEDEMNL